MKYQYATLCATLVTFFYACPTLSAEQAVKKPHAPQNYSLAELVMVHKMFKPHKGQIKGFKEEAGQEAYITEIDGKLVCFDNKNQDVTTYFAQDNRMRKLIMPYTVFGQTVFDSGKIAAAAQPQPTIFDSASQQFNEFWKNLTDDSEKD